MCRHVVPRQEPLAEFVHISVDIDTLLSASLHKLEELYVVIGKLLKEVVGDKKLHKRERNVLLLSLKALIELCNNLDERITCQLDGLDASATTIIDIGVATFNTIDELDCHCACPIPNLIISGTLEAARELKECVVTERNQIVKLLGEACDALNDVLRNGIKKVCVCVSFVIRNCILKLFNACLFT